MVSMSLQYTLEEAATGRQYAPGPVLTVLSYSAGQDSATILRKFIDDPGFRAKYAPNDLMLVMSDTGNEHQHTYDYVEETKTICEAAGIPFYFLTNDMGYHSEAWATLTTQYKRNDTIGMCSARSAACTGNLKLAPIYRFIADYISKTYDIPLHAQKHRRYYDFLDRYGKIRVLIGFAADEGRHLKPVPSEPVYRKDCIEKQFPLVDLGWNRQDCQDYLRNGGHKVPYPSNCRMCHYKSLQELLWMARNDWEGYEEWVRLEAAKRAKHLEQCKTNPKKDPKKNHGALGALTLPEYLAKAEAKHGHMSDEELDAYYMSHGHCNKNGA